MSTIIEGMETEIWQASVRLRYLDRDVTPKNKYNLTSKTEKILQQLHTSNLGNRKWIDVPTEKEE